MRLAIGFVAVAACCGCQQHGAVSNASLVPRMNSGQNHGTAPVAVVRWAVRLKSDAAVQTIYQGAAEARMVTAPMLVIAGPSDATVPPAQARKWLDAAASTSKQDVMVEGAGHNGLPFKSPPASSALTSFLQRSCHHRAAASLSRKRQLQPS